MSLGPHPCPSSGRDTPGRCLEVEGVGGGGTSPPFQCIPAHTLVGPELFWDQTPIQHLVPARPCHSRAALVGIPQREVGGAPPHTARAVGGRGGGGANSGKEVRHSSGGACPTAFVAFYPALRGG